MVKFNIPAQMAHLKLDSRGYPIPFFVPIVEGVPNFRFQDPKKRDAAIDRHLCGICGKKLNPDYFYFVTGPMGLKNQVVSDPAMHRECAEFSLAVCPHMLFHKAERKVDTVGAPTDRAKPDTIFLIKSNHYRARFEKGCEYRLIFFRVTATEKYSYIDNILHRETPAT